MAYRTASLTLPSSPTQSDADPQIPVKRKRGRPRKHPLPDTRQFVPMKPLPEPEAPTEEKVQTVSSQRPAPATLPTSTAQPVADPQVPVKWGRGRPRKQPRSKPSQLVSTQPLPEPGVPAKKKTRTVIYKPPAPSSLSQEQRDRLYLRMKSGEMLPDHSFTCPECDLPRPLYRVRMEPDPICDYCYQGIQGDSPDTELVFCAAGRHVIHRRGFSRQKGCCDRHRDVDQQEGSGTMPDAPEEEKEARDSVEPERKVRTDMADFMGLSRMENADATDSMEPDMMGNMCLDGFE